MRSRSVRSFWRLYDELPATVQTQARQAYTLFTANPDHTSLQFKKLQGSGEFWSVRLGGESRPQIRQLFPDQRATFP